ncbi:hypothetical protein [Candidatus Uabimicrobium sp. HlEnr_7]|uniref:hypothetical protein n=1 Tax=Candidatus Uabimicrobium helgolandensis TaxID=3095367 RepID=UPI003557864B
MSDEPIRPHKPVAALAAIFCLFNGALLYLSSLDFTGDGGLGTGQNKEQTDDEHFKKLKPKTIYFQTTANKIMFMGKEIPFAEFCQIVKDTQKKQKIPEIYFGEDTTNGLHQRIVYFFKHNEIIYRKIEKASLQSSVKR